MFLLLGGFIVAFIIQYRRKQRTHLAEMVQTKTQFEQAILKTQLEIQEETFKAISLEIHDNIGQMLSFIKLNISTVDLSNKEDATEKLNQSRVLLTNAIQDLRDIAKSLNTDFINQIGLINAVQQLLSLLQKAGKYKAGLLVKGDVYTQNLQRELVIFRVVQESLNNIVKHAEADTIDVVMEYFPDKLSISIKDNGKGFNIRSLDKRSNASKGLGLNSMDARIKLVNGTISIQSEEGKGTEVTIELLKQNMI